MTKIRIEHNVHKFADALARAPDAVMREVDRSVGRGALEVQREARSRAPKATSLLTQTILTARQSMGVHIIVALAGYAGVMEKGRKPGGPMPPLQPLIDWIRARRIQPSGTGVQDERDLAFVIGRKIARDGTEAQPFMEPALEAKRSRLDVLMRQGAVLGVARAFA